MATPDDCANSAFMFDYHAVVLDLRYSFSFV